MFLCIFSRAAGMLPASAAATPRVSLAMGEKGKKTLPCREQRDNRLLESKGRSGCSCCIRRNLFLKQKRNQSCRPGLCTVWVWQQRFMGSHQLATEQLWIQGKIVTLKLLRPLK